MWSIFRRKPAGMQLADMHVSALRRWPLSSRMFGKVFKVQQARKIDKSHPIHPRNEDKKKTKLAAVVVEPQRPPKPPTPAVQNCKAAKGKEESRADAAKDSKSAAVAKAAPVAKPVAAVAATWSVATPGQKLGRKEAATLPPRPEAVTKQKLVELAAQARRELGLPAPSTSMASHGSKGDLQVLASSAPGPSKPVSTAAASAWGKPSAPAVEPQTISPQPPMMSQLPQFQQLLQQAAGKKQIVKTVPAAAAASAQAVSRPAPAVPQPVTPPTPVWPALGTSQTSASVLFSAPSVLAQQASREATPWPGSPPSAWGSTMASAPAPQQSTQLSSQQGAMSSSLVQSTRAHGITGVVGPSSASISIGHFASMASAPAVPGSAVAQLAAAAFLAAEASSVQGPGAAAGSSGTASCSSERATASEPQQPSAVASSSTAAATVSAGSSSRTGSQLVGADFADEDAKEPKLTKAQKKNLKRTEKKRLPSCASAEQEQSPGEASTQEAPDAPLRASLDGDGNGLRHGTRGAPGASTRQIDPTTSSGSCRPTDSSGNGGHQRHPSHGSDDPEQAHIAEADEAAVMEELCINCIVARKVMSLITQLQRLGALEFVAAAAVQRHGSNLLAALEWLLVAGADAANAPPDVVLAAAAESASAAESEIDISEELQQLHEMQATMGVPTELLQQCVLDCNGDMPAAANTAMERMLSAPGASGSAVAPGSASAAAGGSRADDAHMSIGNGSMSTGRQGNGVALQCSASFYSVSSLDGAVSVADSETAFPQQQQQPKLPPQPARSSHFGVRLQDEPASCSSSGYGLGDAITAGFMRGGVVVGASGWPNGYLRESPPAVFGTGTSVAPSTSTGRSTSRLLHWLRDEPGRPATLEEDEQLSSLSGRCGLLGVLASDPIVDSPLSAAHGCGSMRFQSSSGETAGHTATMAFWLGSNGYHNSNTGPVGSATASAAGTQDPYSGSGRAEANNGNFSFMSALRKPTLLTPHVGTLRESQGGYGSRWINMATTEGARQGASTGMLFGGAAAASEPDPLTSHADGDNDLSSIMALINVR
ncbi:hypothetical protein Vretifemale_3161 [Volvox reticuliferus]|uniref:UBA domain-containing protein n=1 Tax=Volvox reticuliferus TaxID=1737510 RepID=A0A8J4C1H6_9CHLO|nr:hypothetical protein Vretifemale_3161 [Volvox reticuliferus]